MRKRGNFVWKAIQKAPLRAAKIAESVIRQVQTIPTGYLEAKPARVVSFDEIRMVVAPDDIPAKLASALDERGIPYTTYDGSTEDRLAKLNGVEDVQFSIREVNGQKVAWVEENIYSNKPVGQSVMSYVRDYITAHIDQIYTIAENGYKVGLHTNLPDEYTRSKYTLQIGNNRNLLRAKIRMVPGIGEMIEIATNGRKENAEHTHNKNARKGVYKYTTRVAFSDKVKVEAYKATLVILHSSNGRMYLYDIENIKKDTATATGLTQGQKNSNAVQQQTNSVEDSILENAAPGNPLEENNFSLRDQTETPEFQRWFGNSVVVNEDGSPHPLLPTGVISVTWPLAASICTCHTATPS